jgi:hypothetical protein
MFRQYHRISQPPKASKLAVYKTGKYLLGMAFLMKCKKLEAKSLASDSVKVQRELLTTPKQLKPDPVCVPNPEFGIQLLTKSIEKGFSHAAFLVGCYRFIYGDLETGIDKIMLSFRMGYIKALFVYIAAVNIVGGSRRDPVQHFRMLLSAFRGLQQTLSDTIFDEKNRKALVRDKEACERRLCLPQYKKYQWREGVQLFRVSPKEAKFFLAAAAMNGNPDAKRQFEAPRTVFPKHRRDCTGNFDGPFEVRHCQCGECGEDRTPLKKRCPRCHHDVCQFCVGGIYPPTVGA